MAEAGKMKSRLQLFVSKIKVYWRLFFQRMPLLRNATVVALILFALFYLVRFDAPLNFQFSETGANFQFIQESNLEDVYRSPANVELFDTAPIFIPTRWNYASTVFPEKRISNDAEFVSFEPIIEIEKMIELNRLDTDEESLDYSILYENTFFDPRLLALFSPNKMQADGEMIFSNKRTLRVEVIESYDTAVSSGGATVELDYSFDTDALLSNLDPMIVFLRNENALVAQPKVYQTSLSELFDEQILEWLNQPRHIALLPKGFLKLTFYPN
jgi:hypothetical protein